MFPGLNLRSRRLWALMGSFVFVVAGIAVGYSPDRAGAATQTFHSTGGPNAIPDGSSSTSLTAVATGTGTFVNDITVHIDGSGSPCSGHGISHTHPSDLVITLTSPGMVTRTLFDHRGADSVLDGLCNTTFDDDAAASIGTGAVPFSGSFQPEQTLSQFIGATAAGNWVLTVIDNVSGDSGSLVGFSVTISSSESPTTLPPTTSTTIGGTTTTTLVPTTTTTTIGGTTTTTLVPTTTTTISPSASLAAYCLTETVPPGYTAIHGTPGDDRLSGLSGKKIIFAGGGNDTIAGGSGTDVLCGGEGNDRIDGGSGNDVIVGGNGDNTLVGGSGNDDLFGGTGNDTFRGDAGTDTAHSGGGTDTYSSIEKQLA